MDKKSISDKLSQIDKNKYGIFEIGLFGSYAKDNAEIKEEINGKEYINFSSDRKLIG